MFESVHQIIIFSFIFSYLTLIPIFYFFLTEKVKIIDTIIASKSARSRGEVNKTKLNAQKDIFVALFWPVLVLRSFKDDFKRKK